MQGTDEAILAELGRRVRAQRLARNRTQAQLASDAGVSLPTVQRLEAGASVQLATLIRVLRALGLAGGLEQLVPDASAEPMALLARRAPRRRATGRVRPRKPWTWGD